MAGYGLRPGRTRRGRARLCRQGATRFSDLLPAIRAALADRRFVSPTVRLDEADHPITLKDNETTEFNLVASPHRKYEGGNVEKELKEIRESLAWMRTEQKEMKRWIRDVLRNPNSLSRS